MKRNNAIAIIVASQLLALIKETSEHEKTKGSLINFTQFLKQRISKVDYKNRPLLANVCMESLKSLVEVDAQYRKEMKENESAAVAIAIVAESLSFSFEKELREVFGDEYFVRLDRFVMKQSYEGISEYAKYSYKISDSLRDSIRKNLFDNLKEVA